MTPDPRPLEPDDEAAEWYRRGWEAGAAAERARHGALLRSIEWHQPITNSYASCPRCGGYRPTTHPDYEEPLEGHRPGCALRAALHPQTEAVHRYRPCQASGCGRAPEVHNANRPDWVGHEYV